MTLSLNQPHTADLTVKTTAQDHHLKAAEHLDQAAKCHKETAKFMQDGDHHAASSHAKLAEEHSAHAAHQVIQASKKNSARALASK